MEGWLEKQGHAWKSWKRRWVVLEQDGEFSFTLSYYVDETRADKKGEFKIAIDSAVTNLEDGYTSGKCNLFALQAEGNGSKNYMLMSAQSEEVKNSWILAIEGAVDLIREKAESQWG
jgi:hypothetical protein